MRKRPFFPVLCLCVGFLLGWRGLQAQETGTPAPEAKPTLTPEVKPTPTIDRLAAPPTVTRPTQADDGAYLYWLNCQPCHGDRGQGLTDEWREQYPEEDQNCWLSGCHGPNPYEGGFKLPKTVPAVIGGDNLNRFETLGHLYVYIQTLMPYEYPGVLPDEEYLAITAFLARENDLWEGAYLTENNVESFRLRPAPTATPSPQPTPTIPSSGLLSDIGIIPAGITLGLLTLLMLTGVIWLWRRKAL